MLARLADLAYRKRWAVIAAWIVAAIALTMASGRWGGDFHAGGRLDGTDSQAAYDLLNSRFPVRAGEGATVVFSTADSPVEAHAAAIEDYLGSLAELSRVTGVTGPFDTAGQAPADNFQISADGHTAFATVEIRPATDAASAPSDGNTPLDDDALAVEFRTRAAALQDEGVHTDFAGYWFQTGGPPATEVFGLVAAAVILLLAFGSILAAGLPLITALVGVAIGVAGVGLWTVAVPTADFATTLASMMAIGVGIDYSLFIVTRFRELRGMGRDPRSATVGAAATAGRAVVFAGLTVMVSLLGMLLMRLDFLEGVALGSATAIAVAVLAAVTLLPALISLTGTRIKPIDAVDLQHRPGFWWRWSRLLQRRPAIAAVAGLAALLVLGAPTLVLRLGAADAGSDPSGTTTRKAYDTLAQGFGPGFNGPLVVAADLGAPPASPERFDAFAEELRQLPGVAFVGPVQRNEAGDTATLTVVPTTSPQDAATVELIGSIRHRGKTVAGVAIHVGGITASNADFATVIAGRLPWFIAAVLVCSFLLLLVSFRSVLVPLKAVLMNLLSIGAAYGVMVAVFQWGWLGSLFGVGAGAPIEPWAPMLLFAIVFGLSMDYEVFLLSRVRERYDLTGDNSLAVADGLAATARVISAAAAIMVFVFGFFVFGDVRAIKLIGLGLATAVFIDATVVRLLLVPATMELLGARNWWMPRWLEPLVPHFEVEGHHHAPSAARPEGGLGPLAPPTMTPATASAAAGARAGAGAGAATDSTSIGSGRPLR